MKKKGCERDERTGKKAAHRNTAISDRSYAAFGCKYSLRGKGRGKL